MGGWGWVCTVHVALLYLCGTDYVNFYDITVDVTVPIPAKPFDIGWPSSTLNCLDKA